MMTTDIEQRRAESLLEAQRKAGALFADIEAMGLIRPGATESAISKEIFRLSRDKYDAGRHWHKRVIRTGPNTVHPYQIDPEDRVIAADDIVYLDLGPVFADEVNELAPGRSGPGTCSQSRDFPA
jgi:hypothetical protein